VRHCPEGHYPLRMPQTPNADEYLPLLRTQKNEVFAWIERAGFDPRAFEVGTSEWGSIECTRFAYRNSPYFFDVSTARHVYTLRYSPGLSQVVDHVLHLDGFDEIEGPFLAWLSFLRREVEAPDLWAMVHANAMLFLVGEVDVDNEPFTGAEVIQITDSVDRARIYLRESGVGTDVQRDADEKFDYLVERLGFLGRRDWAGVAFTTLAGIAIDAAFDPDRARQLFEIIVSSVRQLLAG
jgi:hypothetical protein